MSVLRPRARLISFRVSDEEYERVRAVCGAHGARSLSDFVRSAICWIVGNSNRGLLELIATANYSIAPGLGLRRSEYAGGATTGGDPVTALEGRLDSLTHELQDLSRQIRKQPQDSSEEPETSRTMAAGAERG
jgi:hypothetical protein